MPHFAALALIALTQSTPAGFSERDLSIRGTPIHTYFYKPSNYAGNLSIFAFHGKGRKAENVPKALQKVADKTGALIVAPYFDESRFSPRAYTYGGVRDEQGKYKNPNEWTFTAMPELIDDVRQAEGKPQMAFWMIGHSAGGQFVHRLCALVKIGAVGFVAANPGGYILPTLDFKFPYGFKGMPFGLESEQTIRHYLAQPLTLYLGTADVLPEDMDDSKTAMLQGTTRIARGRYAFGYARSIAEKLGCPFNWKKVEAPGIGHNATDMYAQPQVFTALFGPTGMP